MVYYPEIKSSKQRMMFIYERLFYFCLVLFSSKSFPKSCFMCTFQAQFWPRTQNQLNTNENDKKFTIDKKFIFLHFLGFKIKCFSIGTLSYEVKSSCYENDGELSKRNH